MKNLHIALFLILLFALPFNAYAQVAPPSRGGTGTSTIPAYGQVLVGNANGSYTPTATSSLGISGGGSPATSTNPLMATYVVATGSATSTYAALSVSTALNLLGEYVTNLTTWVRSKIDAYLSGGQGITYSSGTLSFDCSEVEGTGINCSGENVTLDATGDWTGTFDGLEGSSYLANSFSTTSADVWRGLRDFFSTTSATYFLSQNQGSAFSTTSANAWQNTRNFFSTTSADAWDAAKSRWATTSADYWEGTKPRWATTSADYWLTQNRGNAFSTTSAAFWLSLNLGNAFSTTSANYWETQQTARTADDLTNNSIEDLSDVTTITEDYGDLLYWTGSAWDGKATSTLGISWNNLADIPAGFADGVDNTAGGGSDANWTHAIAGNYNTPATSTSGVILNGSSTVYTLKAGSTTIDKLTVSTTSTSTIRGPLSLGAGTGDNLFKADCSGRNWPSSSSVGGCANFNFGNAIGGVNIWSNAATGAARLLSIVQTNEDFDTHILHLDNLSDSVTSLNVRAAPNGQGAYKWSANRTGDANSSGISLDGTTDGYLGQLIFGKCSATSTRCLNFRDANNSETFILDNVGNATTSGMHGFGSIYLGERFTDLTGTGLQNSGGTLTLNATGDWTGTLDGIDGANFLRADTADSAAGLITFNAGLLSQASSTIGAGGQTTGLTINGGATTTATSTLSGLTVATGLVGIGTTTPTSKLTVSTQTGGVPVGLELVSEVGQASAGNSLLFSNKSSSGGYNQARVYSTGGTSFQNTSLVFEVSNAAKSLIERMKIDVNGYVGIGTSSPYSMLSVAGTTTAAQFEATSTTATSTFNGGVSAGLLKVTGAGTSTFANGVNVLTGCLAVNGTCVSGGGATTFDGLSDVDTSGVAGGNTIGYDGTNWVDMSTSSYILSGEIDTSSELASILGDETGTGNVVFHTNPSFAGLTVASGDLIMSGLGNGCLEIDSNTVQSTGAPCATGGLSGGTNGMLAAWTGANSLTATSGPVAGYYVATNTTATSTVAGVVGIGTTTPSARLAIQGSNSVSPNTIWASSAANGPLVFSNSGNLGIGSTTPGFPLTVQGDGFFEHTYAERSVGTAALPSYSFMSDTDTGMYSSGADVLNFITGDAGGFPVLTLNGTFAQFGGDVVAGTFQGGSSGNASTPIFSFDGDENNGMFQQPGVGDTLAFTANGTERLTILKSGNIGIASTSPWARLSIQHPTGTSSPILNVASSSGKSLFTVASNGAVLVGTTSASGTTATMFEVGSSSPIIHVSASTSKVGIGCENLSASRYAFGCGSNINVNPNINLLVQDPTDARMGVSVGDSGLFMKSDGGLFGFNYAAGVAKSINLQEFGANVGIATATPWAKFSVVGSATTTGPVFVLASSSAATGTFMVMTATGTALFGNPSVVTYCTGCVNAKAVFDDNTLLSDWLFDLYFDGKVRADDAKHANRDLLTINETREYAEQFRHLPTIKGREEWIKEGGFSLGAIATQLWVTVETLSTHVWELADWNEAQDQSIQALQEENAQLKQQLSEIEKRLSTLETR